jgi:Ca-activated chloride channel family protein
MTIIPVLAYEVYFPENFQYKNDDTNLLFVVDFSNSMSEYVENETKVNLVKKMLNRIAPQISSETKVGMRVYGHNCNLLAMQACRSSELVVPLEKGNNYKITSAISKLRPKGMTPITYSLKQAVKKDFVDIDGKKHIILLTDGGENCDESPCDYAISLIKTRRDINIDVIAFNVHDSDDLAQLRCTADVTGGHFIKADTNAELIKSMEDLILPHKKVEALILRND